MLNKEDNQTLTRVGPGTVMGDFLRSIGSPFSLPTSCQSQTALPFEYVYSART